MMKNKSLFFFFLFLLLLTPFFSYAVETCDASAIQVKSIVLESTTQKGEELEEAVISSNEVHTNLNFFEVGDEVRYSIKIKNQSTEDYMIDSDFIGVDSPYVSYDISFPDESNIIKPGKEKTVMVSFKYQNPVQDSDYQDGVFHENNLLSFNVSNSDKTNNPLTSPNFMIAFVAILVSVITIFITMKKHRKAMILVLGLLLSPFVVNALCMSSIGIRSNISISKCIYRFITEEGSFSETEEVQEICVNELIDNGYVFEIPSPSYCYQNCQSYCVGVLINEFDDDSYIEVYHADTDELIDTITKEDFPENIYSVSASFSIRELRIPFIYEGNVRYVLSNDLRDKCDSSIDCENIVRAHEIDPPTEYFHFEGPWLTDTNSIRKLLTLQKNSICFQGFESIGNNTYKAVFHCNNLFT